MTYDGPDPHPSGERMVFLVPSDRNPRIKYRVDLTANRGYGQCSCADWNTRRSPNIKAGLPMGTREVCCKHVWKTRNHFLNDLLATMAASESDR